MDKLLTELEMLIRVLSKNTPAEKKTNSGAVPVLSTRQTVLESGVFLLSFKVPPHKQIFFFAAFLFH